MDKHISIDLDGSEAILAVHALLSANVKSMALAAMLDDPEALRDIAANVERRRALVERIDIAMGRQPRQLVA